MSLLRRIAQGFERRALAAEVEWQRKRLLSIVDIHDRLLTAAGYPLGSRQFRVWVSDDGVGHVYSVSNWQDVFDSPDIGRALRTAVRLNVSWHIDAGRSTQVGPR
jgi:hypothetical protein